MTSMTPGHYDTAPHRPVHTAVIEPVALGASYADRRRHIETYFDRTAAAAWERLTSTAPVGRIRATVRAGRDRMRELLLSRLPWDLRGVRILDAGCGTGALASAAARRGADVVAIDLSPTLIELARRRHAQQPADAGGRTVGRVEFRAGDMLDPGGGRFDYVVAMDSLIHYDAPDAVKAIGALARHADRAVVFTFAPATPALRAMHAVGRFFPKGNQAPSIVPVAEATLSRLLASSPAMRGFHPGLSERVASGFYTSQAMEWLRR